MKLPNFEAMSLDKLVEWNVAKKAEIRELQAEYNASDEFLRTKVNAAHLAEAVKQLTIAAGRDGRSIEEQAWFWATEENAEDNGHRVQAGLYLRTIREEK